MLIRRSNFPIEMCPMTIVNEDDSENYDRFFKIQLSPIGSAFGVFADDLEDALETLGAYCDDHAKGYIVDTTEMSEEDLEDLSYHFVNGAPDCALDLNECMRDMVEEYRLEVTFTKIS